MNLFKKFKKFWIIYTSITAALLIIIVCGLHILWLGLEDYENNMPNHQMEQVMVLFNTDKVDELLTKVYNNSQFPILNNKENLANFYKDLIKEKELKFIKKSGEFTNQNPCYIVQAGDGKIAQVKLKAQNNKSRFGFTLWEIDAISDYILDYLTTEITINAPDSATVFINGQKLSDEFRIGEAISIPGLKDLSSYLDKEPHLVTYKVSNLLPNPDVKIVGFSGKDLTQNVNPNGNIITANFDIPDSYISDFTEMAIKITDVYANFITNDAPFTRLEPYLINDSQIYKNLRTMETNWFTNHTSTKIINHKVHDFNMYSENCFSCDISFDQYVYRGETEFPYPSDIKLTFIKQNNVWLVGNLTIN